MLYTFKEAELLINYYREKVIGMVLENSFSEKIEFIEMKEIENFKFEVIAGYNYQKVNIIYEEIGRLAKRFNLNSPEEVLGNSRLCQL